MFPSGLAHHITRRSHDLTQLPVLSLQCFSPHVHKRPEVPCVLQVLEDPCLLSAGVEHQIVLGLSHPGFLTL